MANTKGYRPGFMGSKLRVPLPELNNELMQTVARLRNADDYLLQYPNYSVIHSATRRLPILTAANIDGARFRKITRSTIGARWRKDRRLSYKHQLGNELYRADKSDFDKGHMTKREDVQWGSNDQSAAIAAKDTFYFTNAAPQHPKLNQAIWRNIEDYILHDETVEDHLKINVFTGPVLADDDPEFVTLVRDDIIQLPVLFWKVVYYTRGDQQLYRVAFLAGQEQVLEREGITYPRPLERSIPEDRFMDFEAADTYQVTIPLIESLTGL
ncbi:MAG: DNA/RNA non-specific endonuclease, partial [Bacteroidota bacterium]